MGNKLKFLLEYTEYLQEIHNLDNEDDIRIFNDLKNQRILEGLTKTHPLQKSIDIISRRFPNLNVTIEADGEIYIVGNFEVLSTYLPLITNLGYQIAKLTIDGDNWIKEYDISTIPLAIILEGKYDLEIDPLPKILYHCSPVRFDSKISRIGFIPKTGNKLSNHPERIYLTDDLLTARNFGEYSKKETGEDYSIYQIDTSDLKIKLYSDINLRKHGFFTMNNISPNNFIKIV